MIDLVIYTYGYHDALYNVLQAIAMFRNSDFFVTVIKTASTLVGVYYGVRMSNNHAEGQWKAYAIKIVGMLMFVNALLLPTTNIILRDHVTKRISTIDHIPLAFALPIGLMEDFGHLLTIGFEQALAPIEIAVNPDNPIFSYYHYGMLFGARLKKEVSQVRIKDPEFIENMQNFIKQCVVLPSMIGYQFTPQELLNSTDMWGLVSKKAGTLTRLDMRQGAHRSTMSCFDAVVVFEEYFAKEAGRVIAKNQSTDFGMARTSSTFNTPQSALSKVFEKNINILYGGTESALKTLKQQMMINSLSDYTSRSYGMARARQQQESGWMLSSDLASLYLPMLLVVVKSIVYASFIFIAPLLVFSGGIGRYMGYLTMVASLQLWPSLNAVINMIMGTYSNLVVGSEKLVSFSTISSIENHVDTIVTVAGGLQMVVPFLAFALMQGGVGGVMQLAGSVIGGLQSTSAGVGGEMATGNRNFDSVSEGNSSRNMHNSNKTDRNMQYFSGVNSTNTGDGTIAKQNPDGSSVFAGGAGVTESRGTASYRIEDSKHAQGTQGVQRSESMHSQNTKSFSEAQSNGFSKQANYLSHIAQQDSTGTGMNYEEMGDSGKSLSQAVNYAKQLHKEGNHNWDQAAESALKASADGTISTKFLGSGVSASVGASGSVSARNSSNQSVGDKTNISTDQGASESHNNLIKALSNESFAQNNNLDKSMSNDVRSSYEEMKRAESAMQVSKQEVEDWHQVKSIVDSQGATSSKEMTEEVMKRCELEWGTNDRQEIYKKVQNRHPDVMKVWNKMQAESNSVQGILSDVQNARSRVSGSESDNRLEKAGSEYQGKISQNVDSRVDSTAKSDGFNSDAVTANIEKQKAGGEGTISYKKDALIAENASQYSAAKQSNEHEACDLQNRVDKYEKDRIGRGKIAKAAGTFNGLGAPDKDLLKSSVIEIGDYSKVKK